MSLNYRWEFFDPELNVTWQVPRNPDQMGSPYVSNQTASYGVSPIDGRSRVTRRPDGAQEWQFGGTTASKAHYDLLVTWCAKPYRLTLTDHLERVFSVRLLQFDARPKNPTSFDKWKFRYTVKALIYPREIAVIGEPATVVASFPLPYALTGSPAQVTAAGVPGTLL